MDSELLSFLDKVEVFSAGEGPSGAHSLFKLNSENLEIFGVRAAQFASCSTRREGFCPPKGNLETFLVPADLNCKPLSFKELGIKSKISALSFEASLVQAIGNKLLVSTNDAKLGASGGTGVAALLDASPSLSLSNISNEKEIKRLHKLAGGHKRCSQVLHDEIESLANCFGLERLGFFTLTFAVEPDCAKAALKKFNSLLTGVLRRRYGRGVRVLERGEKNGRLHFHCVVVLPEDIRTGFNFEDLDRYARKDRRRYGSANPYLRAEWAYWRKTASKYGFGQVELLPIRSNSEGIARYVGSYIGKHVRSRVIGDKGIRMVGFWGYKERVQGTKALPGEKVPRNYGRVASCRHNRLTEGSGIWRYKVKQWAEGEGFKSTDEIRCVHGPKWCQKFYEEIMMERIDDIGLLHVSEKAIERDRRIKEEIIQRRADVLAATAERWVVHSRNDSKEVSSGTARRWNDLEAVKARARKDCSDIADEMVENEMEMTNGR